MVFLIYPVFVFSSLCLIAVVVHHDILWQARRLCSNMHSKSSFIASRSDLGKQPEANKLDILSVGHVEWSFEVFVYMAFVDVFC